MNITKTIETDEGSVTFTGELTDVELDLVLSVGLNYLLAQGALPLKKLDKMSDAHEMPEGIQ